MGYVAIKGGGRAIAGAAAVTEFLRTEQALDEGGAEPLGIETVLHQLRHLVDRVISEGGVYHPQFAALAIKQSLGDTLEAAFALRAWRSTRPRLGATVPHDTAGMRLIRRISSAFKEIPGGQMLGPTSDYALRLLRMELIDESPAAFRSVARQWLGSRPQERLPDSFPKVLDTLRAEGLLAPPRGVPGQPPFDITREPLVFPVPRSAALATMARAETGSLLAIAYSNMPCAATVTSIPPSPRCGSATCRFSCRIRSPATRSRSAKCWSPSAKWWRCTRRATPAASLRSPSATAPASATTK